VIDKNIIDMKIKTIYPSKPIYTYNEWIKYIHNQVIKDKGLKK
jgi:hypothetical protein